MYPTSFWGVFFVGVVMGVFYCLELLFEFLGFLVSGFGGLLCFCYFCSVICFVWLFFRLFSVLG